MLLTIVPMLPVWQSSPSGEAPQDTGDQPRMGMLRLAWASHVLLQWGWLQPSTSQPAARADLMNFVIYLHVP